MILFCKKRERRERKAAADAQIDNALKAYYSSIRQQADVKPVTDAEREAGAREMQAMFNRLNGLAAAYDARMRRYRIIDRTLLGTLAVCVVSLFLEMLHKVGPSMDRVLELLNGNPKVYTPAQPVDFLQYLFDLLQMADASSAVVMALIATSAMLYGLTQTFQRRAVQ